MVNYNINLRKNELQIINYISTRADKRKKLQSIYQYVIKYTRLNNGHLIITNKKFYDMYKIHHYKMAADTFRKFLDLLTKFGLIIKKKYKNVNLFTVNREVEFNPSVFFGDEIPTFKPSIVPTPNPTKTVGITTFNDNEISPNSKLEYNNTIIIIDNTDVASVDNLNSKKLTAYEKAIEKNNKDLINPKELIELAINKLKEQGRYSKKIINRLKDKLKNKKNIVRKNVHYYLDAVIDDAIAFYEVGREKRALSIAIKKSKYSSAYNTKKKLATSTFANFTQREYDYDKLEMELLGWDDSINDENLEQSKNVGIDVHNFRIK